MLHYIDTDSRVLTNEKGMSTYKIRARIIILMCLVGLMVIVVLVSQFRSVGVDSTLEFNHKSVFGSRLTFHGTTVSSKGNWTSSEKEKKIYAIVFDAGSTGSRVHVFDFISRPDEPLDLIKETFEQTKPGLSAYANKPLNAALSLVNMLDLCKKVVPAQLHGSTPIMLKATAGLRLLEEGQADNILNEVTSVIKKYPFRLLQGGIGIMDGVDEGVFSWMTVNFLLVLLRPDKKTVPALDLGGGSTQITFVPSKQDTIDSMPADYLKDVSLFKTDYRLYTHSYLGLGLMSARFTLTGGDEHKDDDPSSFNLTSPCIPPKYSGTFEFGGEKYILQGTDPGKYEYSTCSSATKLLVKSQVKPVPELSGSPVYIFSYFFDRAVDSELIGNEGGTVRVGDFKKAALKAFDTPKRDMPFLALDLTYIYSLLHDGYHISDDTQVHLRKKIKEAEVSWALGAAFQLMSSAGLAR